MAFVRNPKGAVHSVPDDWLDRLLAEGYLLATETEIAAWFKAQGLDKFPKEKKAGADGTGNDG